MISPFLQKINIIKNETFMNFWKKVCSGRWNKKLFDEITGFDGIPFLLLLFFSVQWTKYFPPMPIFHFFLILQFLFLFKICPLSPFVGLITFSSPHYRIFSPREKVTNHLLVVINNSSILTINLVSVWECKFCQRHRPGRAGGGAVARARNRTRACPLPVDQVW